MRFTVRNFSASPVLEFTAFTPTYRAALEMALGLLTQNGARTSHAAVVARQMGKVCLVACEGLIVDEARREIRIGDNTCLAEGDWLSLDGNEACVYAGQVQTEWFCPAELLAELAELRQDVAEAA